MSKKSFRINGQVRNRGAKQGVVGVRVEAWDNDLLFDDRVGAADTGADGSFQIAFDQSHFRELFLDRRPDLYLKVFRDGELIVSTKDRTLWNERAGEVPVIVEVDDVPTAESVTFLVEGTVSGHLTVALGGLRVQIMDKGAGGCDVRLAVSTTDENGAYRCVFNDTDLRRRGKERPDLQARVFAGQTMVGESPVRYNASNQETLIVTLNEIAASALPAEYETLLATLARHFQGWLGDLQETNDREDITYLANKTGWDARVIALAALAHQFSKGTAAAPGGAGLDAAFFYALFRAGLPTTEHALYQTDTDTAKAIWRQAIEQHVIPAALEEHVDGAVAQFQAMTTDRLLDAPALLGVSSLKEMLAVSLGDDAGKHHQFADLYARHRGDMPKFWESIRETLGEPVERRLRLNGQLAYLTLNNAPLIRKLESGDRANGLTDPLDLVDRGYYRADRWQEVIGDDSVPPEIPGLRAADRRALYSDMLARQVRLSYPTAVVAHMVATGETPLAGAFGEEVRAFLTSHQGSFDIRTQPVERYVAQNQLAVTPEVAQEITRIQRVQRITPTDEAMNALLRRGVDSAYAVSRYDREEFVGAFKNAVGGEATARLIHTRAQHVHNAILNIAVSYLTTRTASPIGVHSPAHYISPAREAVHADDVLAYPTLERLFGEMDYCECEHCRSILSPAAYLVDLLLFLDRPGVPGSANPQTVLFGRRPDIQHLPLTCENTNVPVPYIDLVNETLEYFIVSEPETSERPAKPPLTLASYQGYSTDGTAAPEELLANPQFVSDRAYEVLAGRRVTESDPPPLLPPAPPLPFDQPLENLRRYFHRFEAPLPAVMEAVRTGDNVERASADGYGWRDILMEDLGLSRAEFSLLTQSHRTDGKADVVQTLRQLYGYPSSSSLADIAGRPLFSVSLEFVSALNKGEASEALRARFRDDGRELVEPVRLEVTQTGSEWQLEDSAKSYIIRKESGVLNVYSTGISNGKAFTRRIGISYQDLIEILKTRFVNPNATLIPKLERLKVSFSTLKRFKDGELTAEEFEDLLAPKLDEAPYGDDIKTWVKDEANYARIMGLLTLTNPGAAEAVCSFDKLELRYSDPAKIAEPVRAFEFVRLFRFIRLWKKLGWTIEQTDKAIAALYPPAENPDSSDDSVNLQRLDAGFLTLLPRLGVIKRVLAALGLKRDRDLLSLLACFAPIDTDGASSLYWRMFLGAGLRGKDQSFADDGYGNFLDGSRKLLDHADTLRAAFGVRHEEFRAIAEELGLQPDTPLTVLNISAVFRRAWLARKLKLGVREFLLLTRCTGIDPFSAADPPQPAILRLIDLVQRFREASLKPTDALYLVWNQDLSGRLEQEHAVGGLTRTLRSDLAAVEDEFASAEDLDGQVARARMSLVYGSEATDVFFGLLNGALVSEVPYSHEKTALEESILETAPGIAYDDFWKRLSFAGVLTSKLRDDLKAVTGVSEKFHEAVEDLYTGNQKTIEPFFARYPELRDVYQKHVDSTAPADEKWSVLLARILPELKRRRKRQQALQTIAAVARTDVTFATAVLATNQNDQYVLHAAGDQSGPALDDLTAIETPGLSAQFFFRETATGAVDRTHIAEATLSYSPAGPARLPDNNGKPLSGIWLGYLEAPENGFYNLHVEVDAGATVTLTLAGEPIALKQTGTLWSNDAAIELRASTLLRLSLTVENVKDSLSLRWETIGRGREVIPARYLYSAVLHENLRAVHMRLLKTSTLATALKLTPTEITHLCSRAEYGVGGQGWLNSLPVAGNPDEATSVALHNAFSALLEFARLKADVDPTGDRLLGVLHEPHCRDGGSGQRPIPAYPLGPDLSPNVARAIREELRRPRGCRDLPECLRGVRMGEEAGGLPGCIDRRRDQRADRRNRAPAAGGPPRPLRRERLAPDPEAYQRSDARAAARRPGCLHPAPDARKSQVGAHRHAGQALRVLPDGRANGAVHADLAHP